MFTLELNTSQKWLVMQALNLLSTPQGVVHLQAQYPKVNLSMVATEMIDLLTKFEAEETPTTEPKEANDGPQR